VYYYHYFFFALLKTNRQKIPYTRIKGETQVI